MIHELIRKRYSPRTFSEKEISDNNIVTLLEAARWVPSSMNEQPWRFIIGKKLHDLSYNKLLDILMPGNQVWARKAPIMILAVSKNKFERNSLVNLHAEYDLGQAIANMTFQATSMNIYLHQMGGFYKDKAMELFKIPEDYSPVCVIALGYPGNINELPENLQEKETAERKRKELSELVFENSFGIVSSIINKNM